MDPNPTQIGILIKMGDLDTETDIVRKICEVTEEDGHKIIGVFLQAKECQRLLINTGKLDKTRKSCLLNC